MVLFTLADGTCSFHERFLGEPMLGSATTKEGYPHPVCVKHPHGKLPKQGEVSSTTLTTTECLDSGLGACPGPPTRKACGASLSPSVIGGAAGGWAQAQAEELKRNIQSARGHRGVGTAWARAQWVLGHKGGFISENSAQESLCC